MGWDGPILTDSGGFQVFSLADRRRVDDDGVTFASHLDGAAHRLTPERAIEIQELLGSDIAMVLDELVDPALPAPAVRAAMDRHAPLGRALPGSAHPARTRRCSASCRVASTLPCGPPRHAPSPRCRSTGWRIGGLSVGESKAEMAATLDVVAEALGDDARPRYLMGVGSPLDFFAAVERGHRPVRLRAADPGRPQRAAVDDRGAPQSAERSVPGRPRTGRPELSLRGLHEPLARLPGAPLPGRRAARVSPRIGPQRHLYSVPDGEHPCRRWPTDRSTRCATTSPLTISANRAVR